MSNFSKRYSIHLVFILSFMASFSSAQTPETVIAKINYKFSHKYDTTNVNLIRSGNFILLLGKSSSVYKSYDRLLQDSAMLIEFKKTGQMAPPSGQRATSEELYYYFTPQTSYFRNKVIGDYVMKMPYKNLDWKILADKKIIGNISCQKAITNYHGRDYIAWFTTSLPFKSGPWKLNGLPGLIVTAYDKTGRIRFDFNGFEQVKNSKEEIIWEKKTTQITVEDYKKLAKAIAKDPQGYLEKRFGVKITTSTPMPHRDLFSPNKSINFPLEVENTKNK